MFGRCVRPVRRLLRRGLKELRDIVDERLEVLEGKRQALREETAEGARRGERPQARGRPRAAARAVRRGPTAEVPEAR